jgi:hypothetical protein
LERAEKKGSAKAIEELSAEMALPPFPVGLQYLWDIFVRLRRRTAPGFAGMTPISWPDLDAFCRLTQFRLLPWELRLIEALDAACLQPEPKPATPEGEKVLLAAAATDTDGVRSVLSSVAKRRVSPRRKRAT